MYKFIGQVIDSIIDIRFGIVKIGIKPVDSINAYTL